MNESIGTLSASQLRQAADLKEKIDGLQHQLQQILGGGSQAAATTGRRMSPAAIAKIRAAAKARWAAHRAGTSSRSANRPKRTMSAAARARLAAIARARWKKAKAAGKKEL